MIKSSIINRKSLVILLFFIQLFFAFCTWGIAYADGYQNYTSGYYVYYIYYGTAVVNEYNGSEKDIVIPESLGGYPVRSIDGLYLSNKTTLSVTIPNSLTIMKSNAFTDLRKIQNIKVSADHPTLAVIDNVLFSKADKRIICYPRGLNGKRYSIPQGIEIIGSYAFWYCSELSSITIPNSVHTIGKNAFANCNKLTALTIPDSVTEINEYAFSGCSNLKSIVLPMGVTEISTGMFDDCSNLTSITIPDSVTTIGNSAFAGCEKLSAIKIPESVVSLGRSAFYGCNKLKEITIPTNVISIESNPFSGCEGLKRIDVQKDNPLFDIINNMLVNTETKTIVCYPIGLTDNTYMIPQSIEVIGQSAFSGSPYLRSVIIPDSVTSIGAAAFSGCSNLSEITIPDSVAFIDSNAFNQCPNLTLTVTHGSYAEKYCKDNSLMYTYPDANDWLNN